MKRPKPKRPGAKPRDGKSARVAINVRLPVAQVRWLRRNGMTETIERLVGRAVAGHPATEGGAT